VLVSHAIALMPPQPPFGKCLFLLLLACSHIPHPLQRYPLARQLVLGWRVDMHFLIYAFVALCLSVMWDQVRTCTAAYCRTQTLTHQSRHYPLAGWMAV
jgi:hypothetical protein